MGILTVVDERKYSHYEEHLFIQSKSAIACQEY